MEDIIFEQDYTRYEKTPETERAEAIFNQAIDGGCFKAFADAMDKIPKIIVQKDKENYEYLLDRLDAVAKRKHGRIRGIVDYHKWESHIEVFLPFLGFESPEDLELMKEIADKAHAVTASPYEDGVRLYVMINYFEELMTDAHQDYLKFDAIMQDEKLVSMGPEGRLRQGLGLMPKHHLPHIFRLGDAGGSGPLLQQIAFFLRHAEGVFYGFFINKRSSFL